MNSYWVDSTKTTNYPKIEKNIETEVCIIGGGITGIATAYLLSKEAPELDVTILEADRMAMGVTANTTAKVTSQHGLLYNYLYNSFGENTAKGYLESNENAIRLIENIIKEENIECHFTKEDAYVYTCEEQNDKKIKDEVDTLNTIGFNAEYVKESISLDISVKQAIPSFNAEYVTETPLPFNVVSAVKFPNQAQFHPREYLLSLLEALEKNDVKLYENSKVVDIKHKNDYYEISVNGHTVIAKYLVLATHYPIKNFPGMYFIKMYQESSYVIGIETEQELFDGIYISCDTPTTSFRNVVQSNGKKLLIVGGSGHKTGATDVNIEDSYINLENYIKTIYKDANVKYRWMTEDCVSLDKIPYIGEFSNFLPNMYVATGYKKWGMTTSHVAARIITDKILGKKNPYEEIYTANRLEPIKNNKEFGNMLKQSVYSLGINKIKEPIISYEQLENDSGGVVDYNGQKVGIYKDKNGKIYAVEPYCKHLGCELSWNNLEKTWDCPCHGSRYDYEGNIITEPTTESLDRKEI